MSIAAYIGIVERAAKGYSIYFPDFPGCVSAGASIFEACDQGEQALAAHVELMSEAGEEIPAASEEIEIDPEVEAVAQFVARVELPGRTVRLNITMDESLVQRIDRVAKNRSAFLAQAARAALTRELADA